MNITISKDKITIDVPNGCIECPFSRENSCGASVAVSSTHDYTYPAKCPLLTTTIEVKRIA